MDHGLRRPTGFGRAESLSDEQGSADKLMDCNDQIRQPAFMNCKTLAPRTGHSWSVQLDSFLLRQLILLALPHALPRAIQFFPFYELTSFRTGEIIMCARARRLESPFSSALYVASIGCSGVPLSSRWAMGWRYFQSKRLIETTKGAQSRIRPLTSRGAAHEIN